MSMRKEREEKPGEKSEAREACQIVKVARNPTSKEYDDGSSK